MITLTLCLIYAVVMGAVYLIVAGVTFITTALAFLSVVLHDKAEKYKKEKEDN